jgi:hypothetical protein
VKTSTKLIKKQSGTKNQNDMEIHFPVAFVDEVAQAVKISDILT